MAAESATTPPPLLKVRTVTTGVTLQPGSPLDLSALAAAAKFNAAAAARLTAAGFEVQTTRVATNSFEEYIGDVASNPGGALEAFRRLDAELVRLDIGLFNAGPARSSAAIELVPDIVALGPRITCSGAIAGPLDAATASTLAAAILRISRATPGGEGNFQFCASANVGPGIPFFPAAFHDADGPPLAFAIGCETSALLADALPRAGGDLQRARELLSAVFEEQMLPLEAIGRELSASHGLPFRGIDASVAPMGSAPPLAEAYASLGLGLFGQSGTLAISALVTGVVKSLRGVTLCGFSGLMLPPCEDAGLARRAAEGGYRIADLLMYSAVCGIGLDTVPIPGDVPQPKLAALLLDVAALAYRLNKPLTARLFPVPGLAAGARTSFSNPYLCDTTVFEVP